MFFERYGTGKLTYLGLHGWGADRNVFAPLAAYVPSAASFFTADLPGCGKSKFPREWDLEEILAEIIGTIVLINRGPVTIVGHCGGAILGLLSARMTSRLIPRVVAIDPFAYMPRYFRVFTGERLGRRAYDSTFANPFGRWITNRVLNAGREDQMNMVSTFDSTDHEVARRYLKLFSQMHLDQLRGLQTTVDLVYGEHTFGAVKKSVEILSGALPLSRAIELQGSHHLPLKEATGKLSQIIFEPSQSMGDYETESDVLMATVGGR